MLKDIQHWDPGLSGYKALIAKLSAHVPEEGYEHFSSTGTMYTLSLYQWHTAEAHLGGAFAMWSLLPIIARATIKQETDLLEVSEWIPIRM